MLPIIIILGLLVSSIVFNKLTLCFKSQWVYLLGLKFHFLAFFGYFQPKSLKFRIYPDFVHLSLPHAIKLSSKSSN